MDPNTAQNTKPVEDSAKDDKEDASLLKKIDAKMQSGRSTARSYDENGYQIQDFLVHGDTT